MKILILLIIASFPAFSFEKCVSENIKELESCTSGNYQNEDHNLNYLYGEIVSTYPDLKETLKNVQKSWIKARDSICSFTPSDGEEYMVYKNSCLYEQTYERNRELKAIISKQSLSDSHEVFKSNPQWKDYVKLHCEFMSDKYSDAGCADRNIFLHSQE